MKTVNKTRVTNAYTIVEACEQYELKRDAYCKNQKRYVKKEQDKKQVL